MSEPYLNILYGYYYVLDALLSEFFTLLMWEVIKISLSILAFIRPVGLHTMKPSANQDIDIEEYSDRALQKFCFRKTIINNTSVLYHTVTLEQLGCNGNVLTAINSIGDNYVQWPNFFERQQISSRIEQSSGFKGCVGFLDGTKVVLKYNSSLDRLVTDSTVYKSTPLFNDANKFFSKNEYLLADCSYQLTPTTIIPYKQPQASISKNAFFDKILAKEHIKINHVNRILKGRFGCLN
ncbi:35203_t:CDS:2, partial [Gigaspora margarita]